MRAVSGNRIAWAGAWTRGYNNVRYAELLPRLTNVDAYYVDMHPWWLLRGFRRRLWLPLLVSWIGMRYPLVFTTDWRQIRLIRNRVVCDHDDPMFTPDEILALNRPNVVRIVVTMEIARSQLIRRGVRNTISVVPQGISKHVIDPIRVMAVRTAWLGHPEEIVVGLHQPQFILSSEWTEQSADPTYILDPLLEILAEARKREPKLVLWLVGTPSEKFRKFAQAYPWIRLLGYQPRETLLDYVAGFDIGVYPRSPDLAVRGSIKVLDYMACGIPVVGFDSGGMKPVVDAEAGVIVRNTPAFAEALVSLAGDRPRRQALGASGRKAVEQYTWDSLSTQYRLLLEELRHE